MLNRLIVAAVLLFAYAECQQYYSPTPTIPYGGASPYGMGAPYGFGGYGAYGFSKSYANAPIDQLSMGGANFNNAGKSGFLANSPYGTSETPYQENPYPYQGSPFGTYDMYPRSYFELYGRLNQRGPPPPPPYSGGAPFGHYAPDTYSSGSPPPGWRSSPGPTGLTPINGYKGVLAPNPFALVDDYDIPYLSFQAQYKNNYGRKYDPSNISGVVSPQPAPAPPQVPYAPGSFYYGINYGQNFGYPNFASNQYNGYGQPQATTAAPPAATTAAAPTGK